MGAWICILINLNILKNKLKDFLGIGSAPEFLDKTNVE